VSVPKAARSRSAQLRKELDQVANRVTAEALKRKAAQLGQIKEMTEDPESGSLFVFANRGASRLKALWFDQNGFCVLYKRLHRAVFELPTPSGSSNAILINAARLAELLRGVGREPRRRNRHRDVIAA